jgi:hypothetical protein
MTNLVDLDDVDVREISRQILPPIENKLDKLSVK